MIRFVANSTVALTMVATLTSCITNDRMPYPPSWPQLQRTATQECGHLTGTFRNTGGSASEPTLDDVPLVSVRQNPNEEWEAVPLKNWQCVNDEIVGPTPARPQSEGYAVLQTAGHIALHLAENRSLILHVDLRETGQSFIVPFYNRNEIWLLYPAGIDGAQTSQ